MTDGYGMIGLPGHSSGSISAHRLAYTLCIGAIPYGMYVLHHCDNPPCVNPAHLFLGTQLDNLHDRDSKKRNGQTKLTEDQVEEIRRRSTAGYGVQVKLAREFGMSAGQICKIVHGVTRH